MQIRIHLPALIKACACRPFFCRSAQLQTRKKNIKYVRFETVVRLNGAEFVKLNGQSGTLCHEKSANITLHLLMCSGEEAQGWRA